MKGREKNDEPGWEGRVAFRDATRCTAAFFGTSKFNSQSYQCEFPRQSDFETTRQQYEALEEELADSILDNCFEGLDQSNVQTLPIATVDESESREGITYYFMKSPGVEEGVTSEFQYHYASQKFFHTIEFYIGKKENN